MKIIRTIFVFSALFILKIAAIASENNGNLDEENEYRFAGWPNFCWHHLSSDPEGCSSWTIEWEDGEKRYQLEEEGDYYLHPDAFVDSQIIEQVREYKNYIPNLKGDKCDYAECSACGQRVLRSLRILCEKVVLNDEGDVIPSEDSDVFNAEMFYLRCFYTCGCLNEFIDFYDVSPEVASVTSHWKFCGGSTIFYPYFEKHRSASFDHFKEFLQYCSENVDCQCYWMECSALAEQIKDEIIWEEFSDFYNAFFLRYYYFDDENDLLKMDAWKEEHYPLTKLDDIIIHNMFCSQFVSDLVNFDYSVFCKSFTFGRQTAMDLEEIEEESKKLICRIIERIKPLFLELYQSCYQRHPHPVIAKEIEFINFELPVILKRMGESVASGPLTISKNLPKRLKRPAGMGQKPRLYFNK